MTPLFVSVVIPAYNVGFCLADCLGAVFSQTLPKEHYEVILVNDGSKDNTLALANELKATHKWDNLTIVDQINQGPATARNTGIQHAKADLIAFLDSDCVARHDWLEHLIKPLQNEPNIEGVEGRTLPASGKRTPMDHYIDNPYGGFYWTCNIAYRTQTLKSIGGFDQCFPWPSGEDIDIAHRIQTKGKIIFEPGSTVEHLILHRPFWKHVDMAKTFSSMIRLWRKHPGLLIPEGKPFSQLLKFQFTHLIFPLIHQRQWLLKNPGIYFQLILIHTCWVIDTIIKLPQYYREAHQPLKILEPLTVSDPPVLQEPS